MAEFYICSLDLPGKQPHTAGDSRNRDTIGTRLDNPIRSRLWPTLTNQYFASKASEHVEGSLLGASAV